MEIKGEVLLHGYGEARKESFQCHCLAGSSHIQLSMGPAAWLVCLRYIGDKADSCQQASPKCSHTNRFSMAQGESQPTGKALKTLVFISAWGSLNKAPFFCKVRLDTSQGLASKRESTKGLSGMHEPLPSCFQNHGHSPGEQFHSLHPACRGLTSMTTSDPLHQHLPLPLHQEAMGQKAKHMALKRKSVSGTEASFFTSSPSELPFPVYENVYKNTYFTASWRVNNWDADQKLLLKSYLLDARRQRSLKKLSVYAFDNWNSIVTSRAHTTIQYTVQTWD